MSALRSLLPIGPKEANARLARASTAVERRETRARELEERLASLERRNAQGANDDDEGGLETSIQELITLRRDLLRTREELAAYREARARAQELRDAAVKEAEARQKAAREEQLRSRLKKLQPEVENHLEKFLLAAGEYNSVRHQLTTLVGWVAHPSGTGILRPVPVNEDVLETVSQKVNVRVSGRTQSRGDTVELVVYVPVLEAGARGGE